MTTQKTRFFPLQMTSKDTRLHILQDPTNSVLRQARQKSARSNELGTATTRLQNDYVLQITTWQNKLCSATLFSSKDGHSASKMEISSTVGQRGPRGACRHLSTQVRCDTRYGVDLYRTVSRQTAKINPELPDEGTKPTSQDFLQLPPRTSKYNATAGLVYL